MDALVGEFGGDGDDAASFGGGGVDHGGGRNY